ncbi:MULTISPECIES: photosystem II protein Y [Oscillatoriales]|jgi:photosystem II PsbY protein|uniref:Photosystem II reaction center protein Y n=4 Tax=Limnospira TaxID=2596745 RepID=A0A9P1KJM3_9CYAN|nr:MULTISPECIES: photosystem II protein Y [Oscillatoriales]AMW26809.1 photosystem II protein [Arthrospira platensis YZ]EKD09513.1 photosystem II protein PsbY [Arthrospira platensis C1]KDR57387.1 photosystem II protein [Arthrospira platensis str. Paraca]MBD2669533.1 photosystem II protein Y [Arthrospira platensis FACHB-439]MBD2711037.1 photosystem II protein Y [Arthrospira platensis FACHB-835]MDC0840411.1 photosystem II protein Y [Limnoraphis robusta]MDF2211816.1 photosystem II protein Y [Art
MDLDLRIVVVLLPLIVAGGWALFKIGSAAISQAQAFMKK